MRAVVGFSYKHTYQQRPVRSNKIKYLGWQGHKSTTHGRRDCPAWSLLHAKGHRDCARRIDGFAQGHTKCNKVEVFVRFAPAAANYAALSVVRPGKVTKIVHAFCRIEIGSACVPYRVQPEYLASLGCLLLRSFQACWAYSGAGFPLARSL